MALGDIHAVAMAVNNPVAGNLAALNADGQLIDSGSCPSSFADAPLKQNVTLYINAVVGSDKNDGLTIDTPKQSFTGALNTLPSDLGGFTATIKLFGGTLHADTYVVNESRLRNGVICIDGTGMDSGALIVGSLRLAGRYDWELTNVRLKGNQGGSEKSVVRVETIGGFTMYGTNIIDGNSKLQNGILILSACATACVYGVTFTNCAMAVSTVPASYQRRRSVICAIGDCTGTNNDTGIYASHASLVYDRTTSTLGTIRRTTIFGGLIVDNSGIFLKNKVSITPLLTNYY